MIFCEICGCDPCDCEDMGLRNEFWRILQARSKFDGKVGLLAYSPNKLLPERDCKMEKRDQTKDRIFPLGLSNLGKRAGYPSHRNDTQSSKINGDRT